MLGNWRKDVVRKLGKPTKEEFKDFPNQHVKSVQDRFWVLSYDDIVVQIHEAPHFKRSFLLKLKMAGRFQEIIPWMVPGITRSEIIKKLGKPNKQGEDFLDYRCLYDAGDYKLVIKFRDSVMVQANWDYFID